MYLEFFGGGSNCNTPNGNIGTCINIIECGSLYALILKTSISENEKQYLRDSACGRYNRQQLVGYKNKQKDVCSYIRITY